MSGGGRLSRRRFLLGAGSMVGMAAVAAAIRTPGMMAMTSESSTGPARRMPALFVGHGSPMNAIEDNRWSQAFRRLAGDLPKPRAVLAISAHWYTGGTFLTGDAHPRTIHDFGGFPKALFDEQYPAPGDPDLARRVADLVGVGEGALREDWGLDHGTWTVLKYLLPQADVPVVQLSIDRSLTGDRHLELGGKLTALRDDGVMIFGSGNLTHNLRDAFTRIQSGDSSHVDWAERFDDQVAYAVSSRDLGFLATAHESELGRQCHPTPDHYLPLLYVAAAAHADEDVTFPIEGFDAGSLSMRSVRIG